MYVVKSLNVVSDFDFERAHTTVNREMCNCLGNLVSRITSLKLNPRQSVPALNEQVLAEMLDDDDRTMLRQSEAIADQVGRRFDNFSVNLGIADAMLLLASVNAFIQKHEPWKLIKSSDPIDRLRHDCVIHVCADVTRRCAIVLQPIIPEMSERVLRRLNVPSDRRSWADVASVLYSRETETSLGRDEGATFQRLPPLSAEYHTAPQATATEISWCCNQSY